MIDCSPLFPPIEANQTGFLDVGDGHTMYFEEGGNPNGIPVVHLHGGPGDSSKTKNYQYYDADKYRIILFDQRGCGKSTPARSIENNTTNHLIADIEQLREHLNVEKWVISGGSWGSTLGLLYAQSYPNRVMGLLLRGIFLAEKAGVEWLHGAEGAAKIYPEAYKKYVEFLPKEMQGDAFKNHCDMILGDDDVKARGAAISMLNWEGLLCGMEANCKAAAAERALAEKEMTEDELKEAQLGFEAFAYGHSLMEVHYTVNHFFIEEGQILNNMDKIKHIPAILIHGRYDMICRAEGAWRLHEACPESQLIIVPNAGHSSSECADEVIRSTNIMASMFE